MLRLAEAREKAGLKQIQVAERLGVSRQTYGNYEKGTRDPDTETLRRLAEILNVTTDFLVSAKPIDKTKKVPKDLRKLLEDEEIALNGRMMSEEDKEKMLKILEAAFWEAKEANKRKG